MNLEARLTIALSPALSLYERQCWLEGVILAGHEATDAPSQSFVTRAQAALDELAAYWKLSPSDQRSHPLSRERKYKKPKENN